MTRPDPARSPLPAMVSLGVAILVLLAGFAFGLSTVTVPTAPYLSAPYAPADLASCGSAWIPTTGDALRRLDTGPAGYESTPAEVCAQAASGNHLAAITALVLATVMFLITAYLLHIRRLSRPPQDHA